MKFRDLINEGSSLSSYGFTTEQIASFYKRTNSLKRKLSNTASFTEVTDKKSVQNELKSIAWSDIVYIIGKGKNNEMYLTIYDSYESFMAKVIIEVDGTVKVIEGNAKLSAVNALSHFNGVKSYMITKDTEKAKNYDNNSKEFFDKDKFKELVEEIIVPEFQNKINSIKQSIIDSVNNNDLEGVVKNAERITKGSMRDWSNSWGNSTSFGSIELKDILSSRFERTSIYSMIVKEVESKLKYNEIGSEKDFRIAAVKVLKDIKAKITAI